MRHLSPMSAGWTEALARLKTSRGRAFWRGLDDLLGDPGFRRRLGEEFPALARIAPDCDRRDLLKCLGASLALAGVAGCDAVPDERALPYVDVPEDEVPGVPRFYATAVTFAGYAQPVIGTTHAGRPTKLEGNPGHPASRGRTSAFTQAALLDLYDPDRSQAPRHRDRPVDWGSFDAAMAAQAARLDAGGGAGFRLLTGNVTSPTLIRQIRALLERWPKARWHVHEPGGGAFDRLPRLDRAEVTVCFDADPLGAGPAQVLNALRWQQRRSAFQRGDGQSLLLVAEPTPSLTGAKADERCVAARSRMPALIFALAQGLGVGAGGDARLTPTERQWAMRAAAALRSAPGRGLVLAGADLSAEAQGAALAIDRRLGNLERTSDFMPAASGTEAARPLAELLGDMRAGRVASLAVLESNPAYTVPGFAEAMRRVALRMHFGTHVDETAMRSHWHAPLAHDLESWSDARAVDGTATIIQPLVRPFYAVRSRHALLANLAGDRDVSDLHLVKDSWTARWGALDPRWTAALLAGWVEGSAPDAAPAPAAAVPSAPSRPPPPPGALELLVRPDPTIWDGRLANNAWAQELPKPFTTLTWDNAVLIGPGLAAGRGLKNGDVVRVAGAGRSVSGPVWVMPGQARQTVLLHLGGGRAHGGAVADGAGFDAGPLLGVEAVTVTPTGGHAELAALQHHYDIGGERPPVRHTTLLDTAPRAPQAEAPIFYPEKQFSSPNWGMSIDLDLCIGCNACVTACDAENNIPMVGKAQVAMGREMHWMRVDRYYEGHPESPKLHAQPVPCMHCEEAPCEMGCPVNAAVHSPEGLNLQVYNRCIGTRTCSSFCPYKVRHFNWFNYTAAAPESVEAQRNPNVTVRAKGVMEKCTYCIQRISAARIEAKIEGRPIRDGEVQTACQQACPTHAIVFGDVTDPESAVMRRKFSPRDYSLLEEANTRPRTTYLARIRRRGDDDG